MNIIGIVLTIYLVVLSILKNKNKYKEAYIEIKKNGKNKR